MSVNQITYLTFVIVLVAALVLDLGLLSKKNTTITIKKALFQTAFWIALSLAFFGFLWIEKSSIVAAKFITAYLMEWSLSIDNIFVFILIFSFFNVKESDAGRALLIGILLAIVFRILFIALGIELIDRFHWIMYFFGAFLIYTGFKLFFQNEEEEYHPENSKVYLFMRKMFRLTDAEPKGRFIIKSKGKIFFTVLSMVVVMLAATDIVFALDSIPTVVSLVRESPDVPFSADDILVIYSSNIFAVLGLRSLFFLLRGAVDKFSYLQQGIAVVLVFIGVKMLIEYFDIHISIYISLAVIVVCLVSAILFSMYRNKKSRSGVSENL
ncbi:TerC/Alx family metal homeostasis membrane protein [Segetibacter aerophilus]|uniref:Membrane protein n=1 Tax=Segetibacter aerophilus TaxID=670293 RepID=A0A512B6Y2_9BACT|nr:TerC/Alx family metal homeostasis membrane protein [Segetibacter aerophilus]GEO07714.1 membrane protein [Segetibacter aerophilus]